MGSSPRPDHAVDYCSGCRVCNEVCPTGVKIAEINARARAPDCRRAKACPCATGCLGAMNCWARLGQLTPASGQLRPAQSGEPPAGREGHGHRREAPLPHWSDNGSFGDWIATPARDRAASRTRRSSTSTAAPPCTTSRSWARRHRCAGTSRLRGDRAAAKLLRPAHAQQRRISCRQELSPHNVAHLAAMRTLAYPIIGTSTSCTLTLKEEAPELLDMHDEARADAQHGRVGHLRVAARTARAGRIAHRLPLHGRCCCPTMHPANSAPTAWANRRWS